MKSKPKQDSSSGHHDCTKFYDNLSNSCWDISASTKVVDQQQRCDPGNRSPSQFPKAQGEVFKLLASKTPKFSAIWQSINDNKSIFSDTLGVIF